MCVRRQIDPVPHGLINLARSARGLPGRVHMKSTRRVFISAVALLLVVVGTCFPPDARAAEWKAGVARVKITPRQPMWMSGYASRDKPAEGTLIDLWAKALALDDGDGHRAVLVTMDLCGIDRVLSTNVCKAIEAKHHLGRVSIALCVSHTHTGPVVGNNLRPMYGLDERQGKLVDEYAAELESN